MQVETARLAFRLASTGDGLRLIASVDGMVIYDDYPAKDPVIITHDFDDSQEQTHKLVFEMRDKLPEHTQVNAEGIIIVDRCITVTDIEFDGIALGHRFTEISRYCHDTNGTTAPMVEPFHGVMGCNGRVEMTFSTPIYLWLLENM